MHNNLLSDNLFLHGFYRSTFETLFKVDLTFLSDYENSYKQAMRSRRHSIWRELRRSGEEVGTDSSRIELTPVERAETMIRKIRHSHTNYDKLWKSTWLHDENSGLIHGDYRAAAVTKIVDIFPQLLVGYDMVIDQCVYEQQRIYRSMSSLLDQERSLVEAEEESSFFNDKSE
jgi:hypothetical protein